ncbi:MAG TPA: hypothetical protein VMS17_17820 [Gemmataceae bacterium]|nr:hypothetical protein [Gemmataceae bacterium]
MPRRRREVGGKAAATRARARVIHPNGLYFLDDARRVLRLARDVARAEIAAGRLRAVVCAQRYYIRGQWILDWLEALPPAGEKAGADPSLSPALQRALAAAARLDEM